jgi:hypothetical protein
MNLPSPFAFTSEKAQDNWLSEFLTAPDEARKEAKALPAKRSSKNEKPSSRKLLLKK